MNYIAGSDRSEVLLLPEALEDYIAAENPVRFIDAFVGQLDLGKEGFRHGEMPATGRPPYDPGDLLRLYLYGYLNRVRSSRGLEREAGAIWKSSGSCANCGLISKRLPSSGERTPPGSKRSGGSSSSFAASWSYSGASWWRSTRPRSKGRTPKGRNYSAAKVQALLGELEKKVSAYLAELEEGDAREGESEGERLSVAELKEKIEQLKVRRSELHQVASELEQSGATQVSRTDPDSRAMSMGRGSTIGYNVQAAVDAKHSLIVATEVTNTTSDSGALGTMALKAQSALGAERLNVVADKGYYNGKEVLLCDSIGVSAYVAKPLTSANTAQGLYGKESFHI